MAGVDVSFLDWMKYGVPISIILIPVAWGLLMLVFKPEMTHLKKSNEEIRKEFKNQPKLSRDEIVTLIIFIVTVLTWIFSAQLKKLLGIDLPIALPIAIYFYAVLLPGS